MKEKLPIKIIGYIFVGLSLFITLLFASNTSLLVPTYYSLAINGIVVSRNLFIIFLLFEISWLGYYLIDHYHKDQK